MGTCRVAALVVLLLASALLPSTASSRVLEGEASSGKGAPPPAVTASGSPKSGSPKESGQSSAAGQQAESKKQQEAPPPTAAAKDSKQPSTDEGKKKGQEGDGSQTSVTSPPPPPPVQKKDAQKESPPPPPVQEKDAQKENPPPPPGGSGQNDEGEAKGGTDHEDTGNKGKDDATEKLKEVMEKCDVSHKCTIGEEFSACLQVSDSASIQSVVVLNKGKNDITVTVKEPSNIDIGKSSLHLAKGAYGQMAVKNISPDGGKITLNDGNRDCIIHVSQPVSDWQQQFQQFAAYATRLNPIYGAYLFGFTVVLVGVVCLCCKFARRRGNGGVPYQQLEMSAPAPNSSGANNTTSTADGWDDGWDDDWDDEEAPARPSDKKPASSVSANGLSLRSRSENKDGWDVDWDD